MTLVSSTLPTQVKFLVDYIPKIPGAFVAGGCFKDIFKNKPVKDIDIFFNSEADWGVGIADYDARYPRAYETKNAIGYVDKANNLVIELIRAKFGRVYEVVNTFDCTVSKCAVARQPELMQADIFHCHFVYDSKFFEHLTLNKFVCDGEIMNPVGTAKRLLRYASYGYTADYITLSKIFHGINEISSEELDEMLPMDMYDVPINVLTNPEFRLD